MEIAMLFTFFMVSSYCWRLWQAGGEIHGKNSRLVAVELTEWHMAENLTEVQ